MSFLTRLSQWLLATLEPYGAPGLMLLAICDSSFLSLPEVNDAALMALSIANPSRMWLLASVTVLGSIIGCTLLYSVGRKGGEALLTRRFALEKVARIRAWYQKYGMLAIIVPSLLPPPLPFKIFVLCAGAFRISWPKFMIAVGIGRSIRYFTEGVLAVRYGNRAMEMVKQNSGPIGLVLAALIVIGALVYVYSRRRRIGPPALLFPLLAVLTVSSCVKTRVIPEGQRMLKSYPFTREEALTKLNRLSRSIQSMQTAVTLAGVADLKDNKQTESPTLSGTFIMKRPDSVFLKTSLLTLPIFEMVSDGNDYEVYVDKYKRVYRGKEEAPPSKPIPDLSDLQNKLINLRPKQILDALVLNLMPLLDDSTIVKTPYVSPVVQDRRRYFIVDFTDASKRPEGRLLQKIWFDLSMENPEVVRRQVYNRDGEVESDTFYSGYESVGTGSVKFPSKIDVHFVETDTILKVSLDPKNIQLNVDVDQDAFRLSTHTGAEVITFQPRDLVSQQQ